MEEPIVSSEPMRDMTNARKGTQHAVPRHANAMEVRTRIRLTPSDMPANVSIIFLHPPIGGVQRLLGG